MGHVSMANRALPISIVVRVLEMVKDELETSFDLAATREHGKMGAALALAVCGSLRGPEVFMTDLAGLRRHIDKGKAGIMPINPLKTGEDLTKAPHVFITFIGKFKGETGIDAHLLALASETLSGIEMRWWVEQLIRIRLSEGCISGPAFGNEHGRVGTIREYDAMLHHFLQEIQREDQDLLDDQESLDRYSFYRTFRKTATGRARGAGLDSDTINTMNRWKTVERAKGKQPQWNMVDNYSDARDLMPVTWRYSYVQ